MRTNFVTACLIQKHTIMKSIRNFLIMALICLANSAGAQTFVDFESGIVSSGYNDVRIPGDQGTLISLKDDIKPDAKVFFRLRGGYKINRHTFSLLYAPLTINGEGSISKPVIFDDATFPANTQLKSTYKFNSYRLTYRYDIVKKEALEFGLGFTAKIRDAEITLKSNQSEGTKTNVGFVPIVNFRLHWHMNDRLGLLLDGDALAAKQGRAEDVMLAATWKFWNIFTFRAGYRVLEGGADNDEVYNFTLLNYGLVGLTIGL
jgi:hypothetical protein